MFWCAASTDDDDGDLKEAKWLLSITNYIMNKHSGHESPFFPSVSMVDCMAEKEKRNGSNQVW